MSEQKPPASIFAIYEKRDEALFQELEKHLSPLRRLKLLTLKSAASQLAGEVIDGQLTTLALQDIVLLLVSDHLLASDAAYAQVEKAMDLQKEEGVRVVPILIRPVDFKGLPIASLVPLPRNGRPVSEWAQRDSAWVEIAQGIRQVVETFEKRARPARPAAAPPATADSSATTVALATPTSAIPTPTTPSRSSLRKLLNAIFTMDSSLEAFCSDHFSEVRHFFTAGMNREEKTTLLLDNVPRDQIFARLKEDKPSAIERNRLLIKFE